MQCDSDTDYILRRVEGDLNNPTFFINNIHTGEVYICVPKDDGMNFYDAHNTLIDLVPQGLHTFGTNLVAYTNMRIQQALKQYVEKIFQ